MLASRVLFGLAFGSFLVWVFFLFLRGWLKECRIRKLPPCPFCSEPIAPGEKTSTGLNFTAHFECNMRTVVGSIGHQVRCCSCYGGKYEDPPSLSKRVAARMAWEFYQVTHVGEVVDLPSDDVEIKNGVMYWKKSPKEQ